MTKAGRQPMNFSMSLTRWKMQLTSCASHVRVYFSVLCGRQAKSREPPLATNSVQWLIREETWLRVLRETWRDRKPRLPSTHRVSKYADWGIILQCYYHPPVLWPNSYRDGQALMVDVLKPRISRPFLEFRSRLRLTIHGF